MLSDILRNLDENEKVFIFCGDETTSKLFIVNKILKKSESLFIIFVSEDKIKIGVKYKNGVISFPSFNIKHNCSKIRRIVTIGDDMYTSLMSISNDRVKKIIEDKLIIQKKYIPKLFVVEEFSKREITSSINKKIKKQILNLIAIDKKYRLFIELLEKSHPTSKNITSDAQDFINIIPDKKEMIRIRKIINMEYRPILENINNNNFYLTNISPIVADTKKIYTIGEKDDIHTPRLSNSLKNTFTTKHLLDSLDNDNNIGDIPLELNIHKDFYKNKTIKNYREFIKYLYTQEGIVKELDIDKNFIKDPSSTNGKGTNYESPLLNYLLPNSEFLQKYYYPIHIPNVTNLYRLSYQSSELNNKCVDINPNTEDGISLKIPEQSPIISRKSTGSVYFLKDIFDDTKIGSTKTCNGTNKSGDIFYLGNDPKNSDLDFSQTKPPHRVPIYSGEKVYVCGFYIHSPNHYKKKILGGHEVYDEKNNSKTYPPMYTNFANISDITEIQKNLNVKIIRNIENLNYNTYDPEFDYFVIIGDVDSSKTENIISKIDWANKLLSISPNITQIINILKTDFLDVRSISDIEILLNRYFLSFNDLPNHEHIKTLKDIINENNEYDLSLVDEHYKNHINLKNQYTILNALFNKLLYLDNDEVFNFDTFLDDEFSIKSPVIREKILALFYKFVFNKKPKKISREALLKLFKDTFKNKLLLNLDIESEQNETIAAYLKKIPKFVFNFTNNVYSKDFLNDMLSINNSNRDYLIKNIFREIMELSNLYKIKNIINDEMERHDFDMGEKILEMEREINDIKETYDRERKLQKEFLDDCNGIRVVKYYESLYDVNNDNKPNIYRDIKYDSLYRDIYTLFLVLYSSPPFSSINSSGIRSLKSYDDTHVEIFVNKLTEKYIYLTESQIETKKDETLAIYNNIRLFPNDKNIEVVLDLLENFNIDKKAQFYTLQINDIVLKNRVQPDDLGILIQPSEKYLFKRTGNMWHIVNEEEFAGLPSSYKFNDKTILTLKKDDLENLFNKVDPVSVDESAKCINIDQYSIPMVLYNLMSNIIEKQKFIQNCKLILTYKNTIDEKIKNKTNLIDKTFIFRKNVFKQKSGIKNYEVYKVKDNIPSEIKQKYNNIFKVPGLEQIQNLIHFTDTYGIDFCISDSCTDDDEKKSESSKFWYYNTSKFMMPICCKHVMAYRDWESKTNSERNMIVEEIKRKYGEDVEDRCVCKNCGATIESVKESNFEGFDGDNRLIKFREEVKEDMEEVETKLFFGIQSQKKLDMELKNNPEILAIRHIITSLGITLKNIDFTFIKDKISLLDKDKLYKKFVETDIIQKCMISTYQILLKYRSSQSIKKKKKKKKITGGAPKEMEEKIKTDSVFLDKLPKPHNLDYTNIAVLENHFENNLIKLIKEYNKINSGDRSIPETLLLKDFNNIKKLYKFSLTKNFYAVTILLNYIIKIFDMFKKCNRFLEGLKYLTILLQYKLPEYELNPFSNLSKEVALRSNSKDYIIKNLFYNRGYIVDYIFRSMNLTVDTKINKKFSFKKLQEIYELVIFSKKFIPILSNLNTALDSKTRRKVLLYKNSIIFEKTVTEMKKKPIEEYFSQLIKKDIDEIIAKNNDPYIESIIKKRNTYEKQRHLLRDDPAYVWGEFLPILKNRQIREVVIDPIPVDITDVNTMREILYKLSNNYIYYLNQIIEFQDNEPSQYQKYILSAAFSNIHLTFIDYFNIDNFTNNVIDFPTNISYGDEDSEERKTFKRYISKLEELTISMKTIKNKIKKTQSIVTTPTYVFANNNKKTRNLQEHVNFEKLFIDKSKKFYIDRIKLLYSTYYIQPYHLDISDKRNILEKRMFKKLKDAQYDVIKQVLKKRVLSGDGDFDLLNEYRDLITTPTNILNKLIIDSSLPDDEKLIFFTEDSDGSYHMDTLDEDIKELIEYRIERDYAENNIDSLKNLITIIENKIHRPVTEIKKEVIIIDDSLEFITSFTDSIEKMNNFPQATTSAPTSEFLKEVFDSDFVNIQLKWNNINMIKFKVDNTEIQEFINGKLTDLDINRFNTFNALFSDETNHLQLTSYFDEKQTEIVDDLEILLDKDKSEEIFESERDFFLTKNSKDEKKILVKILIYLIRFLLTKILLVLSRYKNNIIYNQCNPEEIKKFFTSLDTDDKYIISQIYAKRYNNLCRISSDITLSAKNKYIKFREMSKTTLHTIDLMDNSILNNAQLSVLIMDLINKCLYCSTDVLNDADFSLIVSLFLQEVDSIFDTYQTTEYSIQNYIKIKKTRGNRVRKKQFDSKTLEDKTSHKLYRRFGLGNILDIEDDQNEGDLDNNDTPEDSDEEGYDHGDFEEEV